MTASPLAGVGKPLKDVVCDVSILNLASLRAAHTGITEGIIIAIINKPISPEVIGNEADINWLIINPGATPKLITSARESSSFPNSEYDLSNLADNPSRKSKIIAAIINQEPVRISPLAINRIAINPEARLSEVMKFGICLFMNYLILPEGEQI